mmetsp:Transcript_21943/g.40054  ORF Transcript_21943/g.40054 Transcript_21943/m.40054 type:complete len:270 (+) Transcript_21943:46-855(+)
MGAAWAWPCTERDRRRLQREITSAPKKKSEKFTDEVEAIDSNFLVAFTKSHRLDAFLRSHTEQAYSPVAVAQHPSQQFHALVVFQKTESITLYKSPTGTFRSFNSAITGKFPEDWRSNLEHDLNQLYEMHAMDFLGSVVEESGGYNFAFCQHDLVENHSSSFYVTSISQPIDAEHLQSVLNEQQIIKQGTFRAAVFHESDVLLVFENSRRPLKKNYVVTEIPYVGADNFEQEFVNKIELCTVDQRLEFAGLASCSMTQQLFVVLAIDLS